MTKKPHLTRMRVSAFGALLIAVTVGCNSDRPVETEIRRTEPVDNSDAADGQRWFEYHFENPFDSVLDIEGGCIAWLDSYQCWYQFTMRTEDDAVPKHEYVDADCDEYYATLAESFAQPFPEAPGLRCKLREYSGYFSVWASEADDAGNYVYQAIHNEADDP